VTRILSSCPNPFNPSTTIRFTQERAGPVRVRIFDLQGRLVTTLFKGEKGAGEHVLVWNGTDADGKAVGSGVYLINLETRNRLVSRKIVLTN
jgi:flagellar hook assembly protein FlgD